jgi:DeoR family transcriptional regulator of aga operon
MARLKASRLLAEERRREILLLLGQHGRITVEEVGRRFGVSAVTARGDLDVLSESGTLIRFHGGGSKPIAASPEHPLRVREGMYQAEKRRIAEAAVQLIRPLQTVILCTGTTSAELASQIAQKPLQNVTVITYALNIATRLAGMPGLSVVLLGGFLRLPSTAFVGPHAEDTMRSLHADHCFMSTVGLDVEFGLTTLDIMEAQLNRRMIEAATQVTVLADSSKFGRRSLCLISDLGAVQRIITDTGAPLSQVDILRSRGIEVILA